MKFYDRESELELLEQTGKASENHSKMTIVTGRRRIGKTSLILKSVKNKAYIYLFISRKTESLLCEEFTAEIERSLNLKIFGEINHSKFFLSFC